MLANLVSKGREIYHLNAIEVVNAANQLHIIPDDKANEMNKNHVMTLLTDIYPRLKGKEWEKAFQEQLKKNKEES